MSKAERSEDFQFQGGAIEYLLVSLIAFLVTSLTFGLAFPWAYIMLIRYNTNNLVINNRKVVFHGTGIGIFGMWVKWWALTLLTLGIYGFWVYPNLQKWRWRHTSFEG